MNTLDRIKKLVALAGSTNENEARNAAVQACKLITEHKVELVMPGPKPVPEQFRNVRTSGGANAPTAEEVMHTGTPVDLGPIFDGVFGKDAGDRFRRATRESPQAYTMDAPQEGFCRDCKEEFPRGTRIWYRRGVGAVHAMRCNPDILNKKL